MSTEHAIRLVKAQALTDAADDIQVIVGFAKTPVRDLTKDEGDIYRNHPLSSVSDKDDLVVVMDWLREQAAELSEPLAEMH